LWDYLHASFSIANSHPCSLYNELGMVNMVVRCQIYLRLVSKLLYLHEIFEKVCRKLKKRVEMKSLGWFYWGKTYRYTGNFPYPSFQVSIIRSYNVYLFDSQLPPVSFVFGGGDLPCASSHAQRCSRLHRPKIQVSTNELIEYGNKQAGLRTHAFMAALKSFPSLITRNS
jgi:hypothetical protein